MRFKKLNNFAYILKLERGEEIMEVIFKFCKQKKIYAGYFFGLGAVNSVRLAWYSIINKKYTERKIKKPLEIVSLAGIITAKKIHAHIVLSSAMMKTYGGHLIQARISGACEIILTPGEGAIARKYDEAIGLELLDF